MARAINRLSARTVQTLTEPGRHADGDGLYLVVDEGGGRRWVYLYRLAGRRREMGLGPLRTVSLAQARDLAAKARALASQGLDPVEARQACRSSADQRRRSSRSGRTRQSRSADFRRDSTSTGGPLVGDGGGSGEVIVGRVGVGGRPVQFGEDRRQGFVRARVQPVAEGAQRGVAPTGRLARGGVKPVASAGLLTLFRRAVVRVGEGRLGAGERSSASGFTV
ncbi:Arm DNA-binding domain-containing protein [Methylobacterium sp. NFXW15]|uniref:Arm DNA-binding domain-containing protein n=1 Tax=Methylobacterium sp. NFXW15 TaxID=2819512 RepID=UPI003CF6D7F5